MSRDKFAQGLGGLYTPRYGDFGDRYDAEAHLRWLLGLPEFRGRLEHLGQLGANPNRRAGLAWREYAIDEIEGDAAAIERWRGELRRLREPLPPRLRPLVAILVRDLAAPIEIPAGRALGPDAVERLQPICRRKLAPTSAPLSGADRGFLFRQLRTLDPIGEPLVRIAVGASVGVGSVAAVSATVAAVGSWVTQEHRVGYPGIGKVATSFVTDVGVVPLSLPGAPARTQGLVGHRDLVQPGARLEGLADCSLYRHLSGSATGTLAPTVMRSK